MYDVIVIGARCAGSPTAMLLARKGHRVLLLDRARFPSDTISTLIIWQTGTSRLKRWGLLDPVADSGCPAVSRFSMDLGDFPLSGWGPGVDGVDVSYSPRRTVLDNILVDAAVQAGAELREGFSVQEILTDGDRVAGVRGRTGRGSPVTEQAKIVVGADGRHSMLARAVDAPAYEEHPPRSCFYYTYWSGIPTDGYEVHWPRGDRYILSVPTNDGVVLLVVVWPIAEFHSFRHDIEASYMGTVDLAPGLADRVRAGAREDRIVGTADVPNFLRRPYGPGWALVGDAGYNRDPITAFGISDAFRDAELLAEAIDAGLSGCQPLDEALAVYEQRRNEVAMPLYKHTLSVSDYGPHTENAFKLRAALRGNQAYTDRFFGVLNGTVPRAEFFNRGNIGRILSEAEATGV